jgi:hypothetical protein
LKPERVVLKAGETKDFSATAFDEFDNQTGAKIHWSVIEADMGNITETGLFNARKAAAGKIRASVNGVAAESDVKVRPAEIVFLKIVPEELELQAGEEVVLDAVGEDRFGNFTRPEVTWRLPHPMLGVVSRKGALTAQRARKGWILATAANLVDSAPIQVEAGPLKRIAVRPGEVSVEAGGAVTFSAAGFDAGGNPLEIAPRWSVEPELGSIDEQGNFRAKTAGSGGVTATVGQVSQKAGIQVVPGQAARISIQPENVLTQAGESLKIKVDVRDAHENRIESPSYQISVSDDLSLIGPDDTFTATKTGRGVIEVAAGPAATKIPLTVEAGPLHTISLSPESAEISAGNRVSFSAEGHDAYGNRVEIDAKWAVSAGLGVFAQEGNFKALRSSEGFIAVQSGHVSAVAPVVVKPGAVYRIQVIPSETALEAGRSLQFQAEAYDAQGNRTSARFDWSLNDEATGTIDKNGSFSARKAQTGLVFARSSGVAGTASVRVKPGSLDHITVSPEKIEVKAGRQQKLEVTGMDALGNARPVTPEFTVDPKKLGRVSEQVFRGEQAGSGHILVRAEPIEVEIPVEVAGGELAAIDIRGPAAEMQAGKSYRFFATGYDAEGNEVPLAAKWGATPPIGHIETDTGLFHAAKIGAGIITAYADGVTGYRNVVVQPRDLYSLFIHPNPVSVRSGDTQNFSLEGMDIEENPVPVSTSAARWNVIGDVGKFETAGAFAATKAGRGKVTATVADLIAEAYVSVQPGRPDVDNSRVRQTHSILPADGESCSDLIIEIRDAHNNPVPGVDVHVVSSRPDDSLIQPAQTDAEGITRARIKSAAPGTSTLIAVVNHQALGDVAQVTFR